jgi:nucleotide-binding universal stress UspA family protein
MKIKPTTKAGGVVVELGPKEVQLPTEAPEESPVFSIKKLLVPIDFSDCSRKALDYAVPFARQFDAEVVLLHVLEPYPPIPQMDLIDLDSVGEARRNLETLRARTAQAVHCSSLVRTGDPRTEIIAAAQELGIDLIVLSTHGRTGIAHVLLGSTAEKVVRHAKCPILIVRENEHEFLRPTQMPTAA